MPEGWTIVDECPRITETILSVTLIVQSIAAVIIIILLTRPRVITKVIYRNQGKTKDKDSKGEETQKEKKNHK